MSLATSIRDLILKRLTIVYHRCTIGVNTLIRKQSFLLIRKQSFLLIRKQSFLSTPQSWLNRKVNMRVNIEEVPNACKYCRKLMKQQNYPKTLELYRGDMHCLTVDVEKASKLEISENTLQYRTHRPNRLKVLHNDGPIAQDAFKQERGD
jgi:hypothetical protein